MSRDKRAEIVEAMAIAMCRAVHPCESMTAEIMSAQTYLRGRDGDATALTLAGQFRVEAEAALDIALKAVAEIADEVECQQENDHGAANTGGASAVKAAILALTSEGKSHE